MNTAVHATSPADRAPAEDSRADDPPSAIREARNRLKRAWRRSPANPRNQSRRGPAGYDGGY